MADITKLKTRSDKGVPPPVETTNDNLKVPARYKSPKKAKIEFSVPEHIINEFAQAAGERFGFKKGSKSDLFMAMWAEYKNRISG